MFDLTWFLIGMFVGVVITTIVCTYAAKQGIEAAFKDIREKQNKDANPRG